MTRLIETYPVSVLGPVQSDIAALGSSWRWQNFETAPGWCRLDFSCFI